MKNKIVIWLGLVFVLPLLMAACSGATPSPQAEEPKSAESVATEEPEPTESVVTEEPKSSGPRTGEIVSDFTLLDGKGNLVNLVDELQENEQVVLVFYYGSGCLPCMAQLSEIENDHARYEEKSAQVIAISVHGVKVAERSAYNSDAKFPILADSEGTVAEAFGVLEEDGLSTPSVFVINQDRHIVWSQISHIEGSGCGKERVPSQTILENLG